MIFLQTSLSNARQHYAAPRVRVTLGTKGDELDIEVADDGGASRRGRRAGDGALHDEGAGRAAWQEGRGQLRAGRGDARASPLEVRRMAFRRGWVDSGPSKRGPRLAAAPPPSRRPPPGVSSPPRPRGRSSERTDCDRGGASPASRRPCRSRLLGTRGLKRAGRWKGPPWSRSSPPARSRLPGSCLPRPTRRASPCPLRRPPPIASVPHL